ncbi:PREDICTED: transient receptor potential cation channel subfamily A member 1 homolog [Priapulus caudatus]|uniref:Transient receptor potential cation channel subfamily A member 1 homolog n=1 Tax=Priapulus caudatus TaxID=37621 RepID=A0ABM1ELQ0_PRICU|nr:PREDICTED: transient receptor potential cation channel subfamily A member 1 homolog [Priapulus caudatus]
MTDKYVVEETNGITSELMPVVAIPLQRLEDHDVSVLAHDVVHLTLHQAARDGDPQQLARLIELLPDVSRAINKNDENDMTPLHYAARHNYIDIARLLVDSGADVNNKGTDGLAPLHYAARRHRLVHRKSLAAIISRLPAAKVKALANSLVALRSSQHSSQQGSQDIEPVPNLNVIQVGEQKKQGEDEDQPTVSTDVTNSEDEDEEEEEGASEQESVIKFLLSKGALVNIKNMYGSTPLHFAAMRGNLEAAVDLIQFAHIDIEAVDKQESTALHLACVYDHVIVVEALLSAGAKLRALTFDKRTPLHLAAVEGHTLIMQMLLEAGHNTEGWAIVSQMVTDQDSEDSTALHLAIDGGSYDICEILLQNGADVNTHRNHYNRPLHLAAHFGNLPIVKLLLQHNAVIDTMNDTRETPLHRAAANNHGDVVVYLITNGARIEHKNTDNFTPLLTAASLGHTEAIQQLLEYKANIAAVDKNEKSAVYWAAQGNHLEALKELLSHYKSRRRINCGDRVGVTALHMAAQNGFRDCVALLLKHGATIDEKNEWEKTALHLAAQDGRTKTCQLLLQHSHMIVSDEDEDANTPLHLAALAGHRNIARLLLRYGADVQARNCNLWAPLDCAAYHGHVDVIEVLLEAGCNVDPTDISKTTPLHLACTKGHVTCVKMLLRWGASVAYCDSDGFNCLDRAINSGRTDVAMAIIESAAWEESLRNDTVNKANGRRQTPMRKLIQKMPDVADAVFTKCIRANNVHSEHPHYQLTLNFEFLDDTYSVWTKPTIPSSGSLHSSNRNIYTDEGYLTTEAAPYTEEPSLQKSNHPLMIMVKAKREHLLSHPLVTMLLKRKWARFGRWLYYSNLFVFLIYLSFLTSYLIITDPPFTYRMQMLANSADNQTKFNCTNLDGIDSPPRSSMFENVAKVAIMILAAVFVLKEVFQICAFRKRYIALENLVEWGSFISALLLVIDFTNCSKQTGIREDWQWQLGAIAIFLAWIDLILFIQKVPQFGIYVVMFTWIFSTFCHFFVVFFLFIVAFALAFYVLLQNQLPFRDPWNSILKTTIMMIGEFEYDALFNSGSTDEGQIVHYEITYVIFVIFIMIMTILIMNLLVGLAVDDIKEVQNNAVLRRLAMQVELTLGVENLLPHWLRKKFIVKEIAVSPNLYKTHKWTRIFYKSTTDKESFATLLEGDQKELQSLQANHDELQRSIDVLQSRMTHVTRQNARVMSLLTNIARAQNIPWETEDKNEQFE